MATLQQINQNLVNGINVHSILNTLGWLIFFLIILAGCGYGYYVWWQKKQYNKSITVFEIIGDHYEPVYRDVAKSVKLGKGGFEVLYLRKLKTWKLAYGGRVGKNTYYFFIGKDGYWFNSLLSSHLMQIDTNGGLIPVVVTSASMRGQYTALEKQIDDLHKGKTSIWDKYGGWIMGLSFTLVIGVLAWLIYREMSTVMNSIAGVADQMTKLTNSLNNLAINLQSSGGNGLKPVTG